MDREESCSCTCFSLILNGQVLDMFAELKSIEGLADGIELRVVEGIFTIYLTFRALYCKGSKKPCSTYS